MLITDPIKIKSFQIDLCGYKLYRTFNLSNEGEGEQTENKQFRAIA